MWGTYGQAFFNELTCAVNCMGRVKQMPGFATRVTSYPEPRFQPPPQVKDNGLEKEIPIEDLFVVEFSESSRLYDEQGITAEHGVALDYEGYWTEALRPSISIQSSEVQEGTTNETVGTTVPLAPECAAEPSPTKVEAQEEQEEVETLEDEFMECDDDCESDTDEWDRTLESEEEDYWGPADIHSARGLENAVPVSSLLQFRVVRHGDFSGTSVRPWHAHESTELYRGMGMRRSSCSYVATWLNLHQVSLLWVSEVLDEARLQHCIGEEALMKRLKLILRPVQARLPFPAKGAPEADTIGAYFGLRSASCVEHNSIDGIRHLCVQVDIYSKFMLRHAMKQVGFREGNVLDMLVVDWPGRAVLASARLTVTEDLLRRLA